MEKLQQLTQTEGVQAVNDTPKTYARVRQMIDNNVSPEGLEYFARDLERELNSANTIIRQQQLLEEENLRLQERIKLLEAVTNDPHALWANWLRGSVSLPEGIGDVREYQERIKQLEDELNELRSDVSRLLNSNGELERRIDQLEETGDELLYDNDDMTNINRWREAKEAKP